MKCCSGLNFFEAQTLAFGNGGQLVLQILVFFVLLVFAFFVDLEEAVELQDAAGGAEQISASALSRRIDVDGGLIEHRRIHLRSDKAHPDQPIELQFVFGQILFERFRRAQNGGGADGFVRILRVLLGLINVGDGGHIFAAVLVQRQNRALR